jgi:putative hydrolase of HD superfamily
MNLKRDLEFLFEVGTFRYVQRTWKQFLNPDFQNDTEHTFRVIMIALLIARYEKVKDLEKIMKMALVHDLGESRAGDVNYLSRQYTQRDEELGIKDVLKGTAIEDFVGVWHEYEERKSIEAKIVRDADLLDVDLEIVEQEARGHQLKKYWRKGRQTTIKKMFFTKTAVRLQKEILKANPHSWHLNGRNRFNSGDWKQKTK